MTVSGDYLIISWLSQAFFSGFRPACHEFESFPFVGLKARSCN